MYCRGLAKVIQRFSPFDSAQLAACLKAVGDGVGRMRGVFLSLSSAGAPGGGNAEAVRFRTS